jgi:hypothetical protein
MKIKGVLSISFLAIILIESILLINFKLKLDSRNSRIHSLEIQSEYWREVTATIFRNPESMNELNSKFKLSIDSLNQKVLLTPLVSVNDFYGIVVHWDSLGVTSIQEYKP